MRNATEIMEYLQIGKPSITCWEGKTIDKALEIERVFAKGIEAGRIGYGLICDFDSNPYVLEDEDLTVITEIGRFIEEGIVLYSIKDKEEEKGTYCEHCGEPLIENQNHSKDSHEPCICDECFDEYYGYCDECQELFVYYPKMIEHIHPTGNVLCAKCRPQFQETKKKVVVLKYCEKQPLHFMSYQNTQIEIFNSIEQAQKRIMSIGKKYTRKAKNTEELVQILMKLEEERKTSMYFDIDTLEIN